MSYDSTATPEENLSRMRSERIKIPTIDEEARKVIYGDRESTYGHPSKNLQLIAEFWTSYLKGKEVLTCDDVCNMMILMKTARLKNMPDHRDSLVDTIGYTLLKERCRESQESLSDVLRKAESDLLGLTNSHKENHD